MHMTACLEENKIAPFQHGFREGLSTVTQLIQLAHDMSTVIDHRKRVDLIFLDFSKAFDYVSCTKLIRKFDLALGADLVLDWISDHLANHTVLLKLTRNP